MAILFAAMTVWMASAFWLSTAFAQGNPLSHSIRSRLAADYTRDINSAKIGVFRLSIIQEAIKDLGSNAQAAGKVAADQISGLEGLVPTATARNFEGEPPFTATVTASPPSTSTPQPTKTSTPQGVLARNQPTATASPTKKVISGATATAGSCCDGVKPTLAGGSLSPAPGALSSCSVNITIGGLRVKDPAPSSGIAWVKLKYKIEGPGSLGYVYSMDFSPAESGGWNGNAWDAYYSGRIVVEFDIAYAASVRGSKVLALAAASTPTPIPATPTVTFTPGTPTPTSTPAPPTATHTPVPATASTTPTATPTPFTVKLWAGAQDNEGNTNYIFLGSYRMPAACD